MNITEITKITPLHTKDWYVKWVSSVVLIAAQLSTAMGVNPFPDYPLTMVLYLVGILGWLLVSYWWHDRALMILNSICLLYTSPSPRDAHESRMPSSA